MLVLHRPHLPRLIRVSLVAAILAIAISLALASSLRSVDQPGGSAGPAVREGAPFTPQTTTPRRTSDRSAGPFKRPLALPWPISSG
jgi:hypothetical protein